jgi:hypothetical protein
MQCWPANVTKRSEMVGKTTLEILEVNKRLELAPPMAVPVGNSILLATDIESGDAPALCERSIA